MHKWLWIMWILAIICVCYLFLGGLADEMKHALKPIKVIEDDDVSLSIRRIKDTRDIHYLLQLDIVVYNHFEDLSIAVLDEDENELCSGTISPSKNQRTNCIFDPPSSLRSGGNALSIVLTSSAHNEVVFKTTYHFYYPYSLAEPGLLEATWNTITEKIYNSKEVIGFFGLLALSNYGIRRYNSHRTNVVVAPAPPNLPPSPPPSSLPPPSSSRGKPWFTSSRSSVTASLMTTIRVVAKPSGSPTSSSVTYIKNVMQQLLLNAPPVLVSQDSIATSEARRAPTATSPVISLPAAAKVIQPKKEIAALAKKKSPTKTVGATPKSNQSSSRFSSFLPAILKSKTADTAFPAQIKKNDNNSFIFLLQQWRERLVNSFKWPISKPPADTSKSNYKVKSSPNNGKNVSNNRKRRRWWTYVVIFSSLLLVVGWPQAKQHISVFFHEQQEPDQSNGSVPIPPQLIKPPAHIDSPTLSSSATSNKSKSQQSTNIEPEKKRFW